MGNKLVVLGSINVDQVIEVERVPAIGETVLGGSPIITQGGKGANQAVAAARAGADVAMLGCVGRDAFGDGAVRALADETIDVTGVRRSDEPTGTAVVFKMPADNAIVVSAGANLCTSPDMVGGSLGDAAALLAQLEVPMETVGQGLALAKAEGLLTVLNPAPFQAIPESWYENIDCLTPNETEFMCLVGRDPERGVLGEDELEELMVCWQGAKPTRLVVTMGDRGVYFLDAAGLRRVECVSVDVVDTTGAGDTFSGVFAASLAGGLPFEAAVRRAQLASNLSVRRLGAREGMPTAAEIERHRA